MHGKQERTPVSAPCVVKYAKKRITADIPLNVRPCISSSVTSQETSESIERPGKWPSSIDYILLPASRARIRSMSNPFNNIGPVAHM